jgi:hypothetical protein
MSICVGQNTGGDLGGYSILNRYEPKTQPAWLSGYPVCVTAGGSIFYKKAPMAFSVNNPVLYSRSGNSSMCSIFLIAKTGGQEGKTPRPQTRIRLSAGEHFT